MLGDRGMKLGRTKSWKRRYRRWAMRLAKMGRAEEDIQSYECSICGYSGIFAPRFSSRVIRLDAACPKCRSLERHRFLALWLSRNEVRLGRLLHFAPERGLREMLSERSSDYVTCDIEEGRADHVINIEDIAFEDGSFDSVLCSHVLEHVDDHAALREIFRILKPGGLAIISTPVIATWSGTFEDPSITTRTDRHRYFGQRDHVRYFGNDVCERIRDAGFDLDVEVAGPRDSAEYGLARGDRIFLANRPARAPVQPA